MITELPLPGDAGKGLIIAFYVSKADITLELVWQCTVELMQKLVRARLLDDIVAIETRVNTLDGTEPERIAWLGVRVNELHRMPIQKQNDLLNGNVSEGCSYRLYVDLSLAPAR